MDRLQDYLSPNIRVLTAIGLWNNSGSTVYWIYSFVMLTVWMLLHNITLFGYICAIFGNIEEMAACAFVFLITFVAVLKSMSFLRDFELIKELKDDLDRAEFVPKNNKQRQIVRKTLKIWKFSFYTFLVGTGITLCFWGSYPFLDKTIYQKRLPFSAWYPYNYKVAGLFETTYVFQCLSSIYISAINISLDSFFSGLMAHVAAQCQILNSSMLNEFPKSLTDEESEAKLVEWVIHHRSIIEFSDKLRYLLNVVSFSQLVSSVIIICMTMLHLTLVVPFSSEFFTLVIYMFCVVVQILTYCWFGDEVYSKSSEIPTTAYECDWLDRSIIFKKNLIFFIRRTQLPIKLYALGFFHLSVNTFMQIVRTAWSYFILLRQLHTEQQI